MLSVGAASTAIKEILSFSAPGTAFPATVNPVTIYNQLTGVFGTGGTGGRRHDGRGRLDRSSAGRASSISARPT